MAKLKRTRIEEELILKIHACREGGLISVPGGGPKRQLESLVEDGMIRHAPLPSCLDGVHVLVGHAREVCALPVEPPDDAGLSAPAWGRYVLTDAGRDWVVKHLLTR